MSLLANHPLPSSESSQQIPGGSSIQNRMSATGTHRASGIPIWRSRKSDPQSVIDFNDLTPSIVREHTARQSSASIRGASSVGVSNSVLVHVHGVPSMQPLDSHVVGTDSNIHPTGNYYGSTIDTPGPSENSEYDIYRTHLLPKNRGIPLWQPGLPINAPIKYREKGISVGDVGIMEFRKGEFISLFNFLRAADDQIIPGNVPIDFAPLNLKITKSILHERCFASSVRQTGASEFAFRTSGSKGAVLVMPNAAVSEDFFNPKQVEDYITANVKRWYEFVESDSCGMRVEDGEIRVVTGTDKASYWGMATFENVDVEDPIHFEFIEDGTSQVRSYRWHRMITGRAGPVEEELQDLLQGPNPSAPRNQCLFIRTTKAFVPRESRNDLARQEVGVSGFSVRIPDSSRHQAQSGQQNLNNQIGISASDPSRSLTNYLLERYPNAEIIITRDSDWISVLTEDDTTTSSFDDICARVLGSHIICEKGGIVTLKKREKPFSTGPTSQSSAITVDEQTTSEDEMDENENPIIGRLFLGNSPSEVRRRNHAGQGLTTFGDSMGACISGLFVNTTATVSLYNELQPLDNHRNIVMETGNIHPRQESIVAAPVSQNSECDIYHQYLSVKGRGTPLWLPGPDMALPNEYRRIGVSIGDVGMICSTGDFVFLFNIFLPADHEINEGRVPNGFVPLDKSKVERTIKRSVVYDRGSCLASSSLRRTDSSKFAFQTSGREGAILVMPDGAVSEDLHNHRLMKDYIAGNAEHWYEFVESCEMAVENGDIRVVIGTDKTSSWGMATFENVDVEDPIRFEFKEDGASQIPLYKWHRMTTGKAGPPEEEIRDLSQGPNPSPLRNQCVFVRTLNVSVSGKSRNDPAVQEERTSGVRDCIPDSSRNQAQSEQRNSLMDQRRNDDESPEIGESGTQLNSRAQCFDKLDPSSSKVGRSNTENLTTFSGPSRRLPILFTVFAENRLVSSSSYVINFIWSCSPVINNPTVTN